MHTFEGSETRGYMYWVWFTDKLFCGGLNLFEINNSDAMSKEQLFEVEYSIEGCN